MKLKSYIKIATVIVFIFMIIVVWKVSEANTPTGNVYTNNVENYSALGIVSDISTSTDTINISDGTASDGNTGSDFTFDLDSVKKIESTDYTQLSLNNISIGDKIVVQGLENGGTITIKRIVDFSWNGSAIASSTATSTVASTTIDSTASTTDSISTSTDSTATSTTDDTASTTDSVASSTNDTASSTNSMATSTESTATSTIDSGDSASTTDSAPTPDSSVASSTDPVSSIPTSTPPQTGGDDSTTASTTNL